MEKTLPRVAHFMERQKLDLSHQAILQPKLALLDTQLSEYTFANLYLFREVHDYECLMPECDFVFGKTYDGGSFAMPTSLEALQQIASQNRLWDGVDFLFPIAQEWLSLFDQELWQATYKEEESDYLFDMQLMATYKGRHLSKKRNLVKQLVEHYEMKSERLEEAHLSEAQKVLESWNHNVQEHSDFKPCSEALKHFVRLGLEGEIFYADNEPAGFTIGEPLGKETFVIHFAKADIRFKGIYQYIYQAYAQKLLENYHLLNMEQDLGSQELRQAKHSYQPARMANKFRLSPL